jgi:hypothetical protein
VAARSLAGPYFRMGRISIRIRNDTYVADAEPCSGRHTVTLLPSPCVLEISSAIKAISPPPKGLPSLKPNIHLLYLDCALLRVKTPSSSPEQAALGHPHTATSRVRVACWSSLLANFRTYGFRHIQIQHQSFRLTS